MQFLVTEKGFKYVVFLSFQQSIETFMSSTVKSVCAKGPKSCLNSCKQSNRDGWTGFLLCNNRSHHRRRVVRVKIKVLQKERSERYGTSLCF